MSQKRYAYLIGANGPQTDRLATLKYAEKDAQRLAEALLASPCSFTKAEWMIAESRQPTLIGLKNFVMQCDSSDLLLVHFSGHADHEDKLFLLCNDTDDYTSSAIEINAIKKYLGACKARHKVLVLDCCHAGAAHTGAFKGDQDIKSALQQTLEGSVNVILSACSRRDRTRELDTLDGGAGFLSWTLATACTSRFQKLSPNGHSLSLMDIWQWIPTALQEVNDRLGPKEKLPQPILLSEMKAGDDSEIWLTELRRAHTSKFVPDDGLTRNKYLESVSKRYSSVTLPLGPAEGFSLHAVFQPLELRRDPLAAEDLDRKKRRSFLGERLEDEKNADRFHSQRGEKERTDEKQKPVMAENGEDALTKSPQRRLVILGGPGTGKTTTLKHFVGCRTKEALGDPNAPIPIFLSLADLARSDKTLQSYLVGLVEELGIERTYAENLWKTIEAGQAFVCLDSLDEVEPQRRQKMIEWVNAWAAESGNTWVVGSRFTEYKNGSFKHGRFAEWELLPMDHELRLELAERLLPELQRLLQCVLEKSLSSATFVKLLEDHPQAAAWGENPLLFSLAAVVFLQTGGLPASRAILYREVIDAILKTREASPVWQNILLRLLAQFALWLHQTKGRVFTINDLVSFLADLQGKSLEETADLADRILRSGMMEPVAHQTYGFRHQTFQEYLAAVELAQKLTHQNSAVQEEAWKLAWSKRTYSRWTEVLRLMVGVLSQQSGNKGKSEARRWLRELIGQRSTEEGDPGDLGLALALKSLAEITEGDEIETIKTVQLEKDILFIWLEEFLQTARLQQKAKQKRLQSLARDVFHLHGGGVDKVIDHLVKALWNQKRNVRNIVCAILQGLGQRVPIEPLFMALDDPDAQVRKAAIEVLGARGKQVPIRQLLEALHDEHEHVRVAAIRALGRQGERVPIEPLLAAALHDEHERVRVAAIRALGGRGERVPIEPLLAALRDADGNVRWAAVEALGRQGERVPIEPLLKALQDEKIVSAEVLRVLRIQMEHDEKIVSSEVIRDLIVQKEHISIESLLKALQDENGVVRSAAVQILRAQRKHVPIEPLLEALQDEDGNIRLAAMQVLRAQREHVPIEPLFEALRGEDKHIRWAAVQVLIIQGKCVPLESLLSFLQDKARDVRQAAIKALRAQGERIPIELLLKALRDECSFVCRAAIEALRAQGEHIPIELLLERLQDEDEHVRQAAIEALIAQEENVPIEPLLGALQDKDKHIRWVSVAILREQGERVPIEPLLKFLQGENRNVRRAAIAVLRAQAKDVPVEPLLEALQDEDGMVRSVAVAVLRAQGKCVPIEPLFRFLQDEDGFIRCTAIAVLRAQGERIPVELLFKLLQDKDSNVRLAAVRSLGSQEDHILLEPLFRDLHDKGISIHLSTVRALGAKEEHISLELLLKALQDKESDVRRIAVAVLGAQGKRVPQEPLLTALQDKNGYVRSSALAILRAQGEDIPIDVKLDIDRQFSKEVQSSEISHVGLEPVNPVRDATLPYEKWVMLWALEMQWGLLPIECWLEALHHEEEIVRQLALHLLEAQEYEAVRALGGQGECVPIEPLLKSLQDEESYVRSEAVRALGKQGKHMPIEPLLEALYDESEYVRQEAVEALGAQGERVPFESVLDALYDPDGEVREKAIQVLGAQGELISSKYILEALGDKENDVRREAIKILSNRAPDSLIDVTNEAMAILNGQPFGPILGSIAQTSFCQLAGELKLAVPAILDELTGLLNWPHWQVRTNAVRALGSIRRNIPDAAIRGLLELRRHDPVRVVREAADDALAEILSLETSIEDD